MGRFEDMGLYLALYGGLLTDRQRHAMELHYSYDLSLSEIAEQMQISRQGVHDLIQRSEQQLSEMEAVVGMGSILRRVDSEIEDALDIAREIEDIAVRENITRKLIKVRDIFTEGGEN